MSQILPFSSIAFSSFLPIILAISAFAYTVYGAIWRLYLSPVAKFPVPWFAALTFWNEFYYDVLLGGKYTFKITEYHERYGPIIRINPYEIHIKDPEFSEVLCVGASKRKSNKWYWSMRMLGQSDLSAFDTLDHDKHRMRREPWNQYFSKQSVSRLQPLLIQTAVNKLGYGLLDRPEFDSENYQAWMALSKISHTLKQFGWLYPLLSSMPLWVTKLTSPETYLILSQAEHLYQQALGIQAQRGKSEYKESTARPSILAAFLDSDLPESEKTAQRIAGEAQIAIGAGTLTSSHALKYATYHLLANPPILERLMGDLQKAIPDPESPPNLRELEQIPYLVAILYETLRIFHGVSHRLQRIFPDHSIQYKESVIPPGTPVGMTSVHTHNDPNIFPDPYAFKPERWLPLPTEGQRLQKYLMAFGKGSRQCVGMDLGKAEILTALANVL